jgi:hypothetical protein
MKGKIATGMAQHTRLLLRSSVGHGNIAGYIIAPILGALLL